MKRKNPFGVHRYAALLNSLCPNEEELKELISHFNKIFQSLIIPSGECTIDETVFSYEPKVETKNKMMNQGDQIPLVYIPRKPHPNGLLTYVLACTTPRSNKPFVLNLVPFKKFPQITAREALQECVQQWPYTHPPHITGDSAFGSPEFFNLTTPNGSQVFGTFSISSTILSQIWKALSFGCAQDTWRIATKGDLLASVLTSVDDKGKMAMHQLLTNAFAVNCEVSCVTCWHLR